MNNITSNSRSGIQHNLIILGVPNIKLNIQTTNLLRALKQNPEKPLYDYIIDQLRKVMCIERVKRLLFYQISISDILHQWERLGSRTRMKYCSSHTPETYCMVGSNLGMEAFGYHRHYLYRVNRPAFCHT